MAFHESRWIAVTRFAERHRGRSLQMSMVIAVNCGSCSSPVPKNRGWCSVMVFDKQNGHGVPWRAGRVSVPVSRRHQNALSASPVCRPFYYREAHASLSPARSITRFVFQNRQAHEPPSAGSATPNGVGLGQPGAAVPQCSSAPARFVLSEPIRGSIIHVNLSRRARVRDGIGDRPRPRRPAPKPG